MGVRLTVLRCLALATLPLLAGCPSIPPAGAPSHPQVLSISGSYRHAPSGMEFPVSVDDFQRVLVIQYDAAGLNVSAGYNLNAPLTKLAATFYVYPAPSVTSIGSPASVVATARAELCRRHFAAVMDEVVRAHPAGKLIRQEEVTLQQAGRAYPGWHAVFAYPELFAGAVQALSSEAFVYCYVAGKWVMKYRFTGPENQDAGPIVREFMQRLAWTLNADQAVLPSQAP